MHTPDVILLTGSQESVLVVEYGYLDNSTETLWPYYVQGVGVNTADTDTLLSVPQQGLGNLTFSLSVGKVLGGGSIVNGMYFDRGMRSDYDSWEELGNEDWNWQSMLGYFKKVYVKSNELHTKDDVLTSARVQPSHPILLKRRPNIIILGICQLMVTDRYKLAFRHFNTQKCVCITTKV